MTSLASVLSYSIKLNGNELADRVLVVVRSIRCDLSLGAASRCSIVIAVGFPTPEDVVFSDTDVSVGTSLEVGVGWDGSVTTIFTGEVVSVGTELGNDGFAMVIEALDKRHLLGSQFHIRSWVTQSDSDVLSAIASECGLSAQIADTSTTVHEHRFQIGTNQQFVEEICRRSGLVWWLDGTTLHVAKPEVPSSSVVTLQAGVDLIDLSLRRSSSEQVNEVTVRGWDPAAKQSVVSTSSDETKPTTTSFQARFGDLEDRPVTSVRAPVVDATHATSLADGLSRRFMADTLVGFGRALGSPQVVPGARIALSGVPGSFNGDYDVTSACHVIEAGGWYVDFTVGSLEATSLVDLVASPQAAASGSPARGFGAGVTVGIVTDIADPDGYGRVKVKYPYLSDDLESNWVRVAVPGGGLDRGSVVLPEVDDEVVVAFEHGDPDRGYVLGGLFNGTDLPPADLIENGQVVERVIRSRAGHQIRIHDGDGDDQKLIALELSSLETKAIFAQDRIEIEVGANKPISLTAGDSSVVIDDQGNVTVDAGGGTIDLTTTGDVSISGANVSIEASGSFAVKASRDAKIEGMGATVDGSPSTLVLKGQMVQVN